MNGVDHHWPDDDGNNDVADTTTMSTDESEVKRSLQCHMSTLEGELARAKACIATLVVDNTTTRAMTRG